MRHLVLFLLIAVLVLGCADDPDKYAKVVFADSLIITTTVEDFLNIEGRLKNIGDIPAYDITVWITSYNPDSTLIGFTEWVYPDTVFPDNSIIMSATTYGIYYYEIEYNQFDIEWRE